MPVQVSSAAMKCATALCTTLANPDLIPHIPVLVKCMSDPDSVPACIKALSNTTFVAEVTAPALAVLVPLMIRALNDRSMEVQRRSVVVIDNLVKLVRDPTVAATYLSPLVEGVEKIAKGAAFPEVSSCNLSIRVVSYYNALLGPRVCRRCSLHSAEVRRVQGWPSSRASRHCGGDH